MRYLLTVCKQATAALLLLMVMILQPARAESFLGRSVQSALTEIAGDDLRLIYNDQIVPPDLQVTVEPAVAAPRVMLDEILSAHALALSEIRPGLYVIVAAEPVAAAAATMSEAPDLNVPRPLPDLVVTTSRYALRYDEPGSFTHLGEALVQNLPKAADETLRVLHRLPGAASGGVSAPPNIRGGEQGEILYLLDGLQLYEPFHGKDFFNIVSIFDSRFVSGIDVFTGGYTANYGDRMSGVVDIQPLVVPEDNEFELGINLFHSSGLGAGRFAGDRGTWIASFRRSNLDEIADLSNSDFGEAKYYDMLIGAGYELTPATRLGLHYMRSADDIAVNDSARTETASAGYRNDYLWGYVEHDWSRSCRPVCSYRSPTSRMSATGLSTNLASAQGNCWIDGVSTLARQNSTFAGSPGHGQQAGALKVAASRPIIFISVGWILRPTFRFRALIRLAANVNISARPEGYQASAYLSGRYAFADRWSAELGLRWDDQDYDGLDDREQLSPRLNLSFAPTASTQLRLAWGRFYQTQGIHELQVEDGIDRFFPAQFADHFVIGIDQLLPADIQLRVEAYQKDFSDLRPRFENLFDPLTLAA